MHTTPVKKGVFGIVCLLVVYILSRLVNFFVTRKNRLYEKEYSTCNSKLISDYKASLNEQKEIWQQDVERLNNLYTPTQRRELLRHFLLCFSNRACAPQRRPNKGYSENFFWSYLNEYFGDTVYVDVAISAFKQNGYLIYPDFLIYLPTYNLHLAIEIDEWYDLKNLSPLHYRNNDINADMANEDSYKNAHWFIMRFSEEQIASEPEQCCTEINNFINEIIFPEEVEYIFCWSPIDISHPCWTKAQSEEFALERKRCELQKRIESKDPFYSGSSDTLSNNNIETYYNRVTLRECKRREEYLKLLNGLEGLDFDSEVERHIREFKHISIPSDDDLPF